MGWGLITAQGGSRLGSEQREENILQGGSSFPALGILQERCVLPLVDYGPRGQGEGNFKTDSRLGLSGLVDGHFNKHGNLLRLIGEETLAPPHPLEILGVGLQDLVHFRINVGIGAGFLGAHVHDQLIYSFRAHGLVGAFQHGRPYYVPPGLCQNGMATGSSL